MAALLRIARSSGLTGAASTSSGGGLLASLLTPTRGFQGSATALAKAAAAAPKKKGQKHVAEDTGMSETHATGMNYMKGGQDPELGPDSVGPG
jgi:hypothetical protein